MQSADLFSSLAAECERREVGASVTEMTGADLEGRSDADLRRLVRNVAVFARVNPEHKLRIVEALKAEGAIVAMMGDGVNDAAAMKRADIGVAMGQRGSDVTREVADSCFSTTTLRRSSPPSMEGRSIYENIQKFVRFLFSTNLSEVLVVTLGVFAAFLLDLRGADGALVLPLTAAQLLWIKSSVGRCSLHSHSIGTPASCSGSRAIPRRRCSTGLHYGSSCCRAG